MKAQPTWRGYFGKIPLAGDFVSHGLPPAVETVFDEWLRAAIRDSQQERGRRWLDAFLVTPVWRFAMEGGVAGPQPLAGVMMPSVDRVGRYFPLVIACARPDLGQNDLLSLCDDLTFFDAAEALAMSCLHGNVSAAALTEGVACLPTSPLPNRPRSEEFGDAPSAFWWTGRNGERSHYTDYMPQHSDFSEFFIGNTRAEADDERRPVLISPAPEDAPPAPPPPAPVALLYRDYAAASLRGTRSAGLTDATAMNADHQAFSLLAGIGPSPTLPTQVKGLVPLFESIANPFSMNDLIAEAKGKLGSANTRLAARAEIAGEQTAVAALVLLIQARRYGVLWSGNCTAFMARGGTLHQINRPHTDSRLRGIVTHALGARRTNAPDSSIGQVEDGDRFLLASPGVTEMLSFEEIAEILAGAQTPQMAVTELTQNALIAGATLDATALCVFLSPHTG